MNPIIISGVTTEVIAYQNNPVVTTKQLSDFYGCDEKAIRQNFNNNKGRFEEGKHFVKLIGKQVSEFIRLSNISTTLIPESTTILMLWTAKGAARHAKMLSTEKAWEVFEILEDSYFNTKQADKSIAINLRDNKQLTQVALQLIEINQEQEEKIKVLEPQAKALNRLAVFSEGSYCIRDSAKMLQIAEKKLQSWLFEHGWIYRRPTGGALLGYAPKLQKGYLEHKLTTGDKTDGSGGQWSRTQVRVTAKGLAKLALLLGVTLEQGELV